MGVYKMEQLSPYLYGTYGQLGINNPYQGSGSSFGEMFQSALQTTESMENIFQEAANTYNVSLNLLKAIGKAESNFNPQAVSSAGAQGVMQLMPATARSLGVTDSFDARSNIMGGAKYISGLLDKYNGNVALALSAYNAGSGNVAKYGGIPPFKETQNYVKKVMEYMGGDFDLSGILTFGVQNYNPYQSLNSSTVSEDADSDLEITFTSEDAQYLIEMMKLKMQTMFFTGFGSDEEEEENSIFF